ncbi:hypothetical protein BGZ92_004373 [Podila epicladia]|nr:hypothetical protein BGZ92_004373 [Podila epicladia]
MTVYETWGDPFTSKDELRNGPQALLTANLPYLVDPAPSRPDVTTSSANKNLLLTEEVELTTAHLVLMPYLQVQPESTPPLPAVSTPSASTSAVSPKVQTPPSTPEKSPKRNSFRKNEGDQKQQQQGSFLASIQESAVITVTGQKPNHAHHPYPPPIATKINTGVASDSGNTSTVPPPPRSRKTPTRPGLHGRESSSSSVGSPTSTLVATPTSATTPRSPPVSATPPPVPAPPLAYAYAIAAEIARSQAATDAARTGSPSPSNTSSNISTGLSIISSIYSTAPSSGVSGSPVGSTTNVSCATSPTIYSPTTPSSINGGVDSAVIRNHAGSYYHDDFLKKYNPPSGIIQKHVGVEKEEDDDEEDEDLRHRRDTLVTEHDSEGDDRSGWLYKAAYRGNEKRVNHPQAVGGAGTRFSQFNFQNE